MTQENEFVTNLQLTSEQIELVKACRQTYVQTMAEIADMKEGIKYDFEFLFDSLNFDKKINKSQIKAIKEGFKLYYKDSVDATRHLTEEAIVVAEL